MRVLVDTHTLIWWANDSASLSRRARAVLASFDSDVFVSAVSAWELTTKVRLGKLPEAEVFAADFSRNIETLGFQGLSVTVEHGQRAGLLPGLHRDPFDRMLIAQAMAEDLSLVSNEELFDEYKIRRIW